MRKFLLFVALVSLLSSEKIYAQFQQSNLPIIVINTNGKTIVDDPKILVDFKVFYRSDGGINSLLDENPHFNGKAGIEFRGSSSLIHPKKSYSVELADDEGEDIKFPLLGLPSEADWALIANYDDKTALKNAYVYNLWAQTGRYSPRTRHVEVVINNEYMGLYVLTEKIKRDSKRIDIKKNEEADTTSSKITGGYIIEASRESQIIAGDYIWRSQYGSTNPTAPYYMTFECVYPKKPVNKQFNYIKNYIKDFETSLKSTDFKDPDLGFRKYIDEESFIDNFVIQEYSIHMDIFARSQFFYKDRGGKMVASPLWDTSSGLFDDYTDTWRFSCSGCDPRFFWPERMMQDCNFKSDVIDRYKELRRTFLTYEKSAHYIDSVATTIKAAAERDRARWHSSGGGTFLSDVQKLKTFVSKRLSWLDKNIHSITDAGSLLGSSSSKANVNQTVTLTSSCSKNNPVLWTYDTDDGETGSFVGSNVENVLFTKDITYFAKCQSPCPSYTNIVRISLNGTCPDNITINESTPNPQVQDFVSKYTITSTASIGTNSKTRYSSGNSILLSAGFKATSQEVFLAEIEGCN